MLCSFYLLIKNAECYILNEQDGMFLIIEYNLFGDQIYQKLFVLANFARFTYAPCQHLLMLREDFKDISCLKIKNSLAE